MHLEVIAALSEVLPKNELEKSAWRFYLQQEPGTVAAGIWHGKGAGKVPSPFGDGSALQWIGLQSELLTKGSLSPLEFVHVLSSSSSRRGILPAHITLPPTTLAPTRTFTQRKPQVWCRGTCHEAKGRLERTRAPPSIAYPHFWVCHLSSLGDQHLKDAQSNPTCRMRSIPCPVKLLFSLKEVQSPLREGHGGVCEQPSPTLQ